MVEFKCSKCKDCDMDNDVNISDATTLINYLLAPQW